MPLSSLTWTTVPRSTTHAVLLPEINGSVFKTIAGISSTRSHHEQWISLKFTQLDHPSSENATFYALSSTPLFTWPCSTLPQLQISYKYKLWLYQNQIWNKLHLQRPLTNSYRSSFEFQGTKGYNSLPSHHLTNQYQFIQGCNVAHPPWLNHMYCVISVVIVWHCDF